MTTEPLSRTILLLDVERLSDRDDVEQAYLRSMLHSIADRTLEAAGVDETVRLRADRSDSVMELIDAGVSVRELLRTLLREVPDPSWRSGSATTSITPALRERADHFALCVLQSVYAGIVRHNHPGIAAEEFTQVTMTGKNGPLAAWLYGPAPSGSGAGAGESDAATAERHAEPGQAAARATAQDDGARATTQDADARATAQTDASAPAAGGDRRGR